jgi:hypothetical protein
MSRDERPDESAPDDKAARLRESVQRLVLLKETGPKSAAWHRARVRSIWRLHRALESLPPADQAAGSPRASPSPPPADDSLDEA